jgi:hypothetical protein
MQLSDITVFCREHNTQEDTAIAAVKQVIAAHEMRLNMAEVPATLLLEHA